MRTQANYYKNEEIQFCTARVIERKGSDKKQRKKKFNKDLRNSRQQKKLIKRIEFKLCKIGNYFELCCIEFGPIFRKINCI